MKFNATQLLEKVIELKASDLHLSVGVVPTLRINSKLVTPISEIPPLKVEDVEFFLSQVLEAEQKEVYEVNKEIDFSIALGDIARFRVNAFYQKGLPAVSLRAIPSRIPTFEELNLPAQLSGFCDLKQGLVLVVGPTSHGKSTTIASMIDHINNTRPEHILSIEDPIEYVFKNNKSLIEQREMYVDTHSWEVALRSILRQDPNIVLIGEMRDTETVSSALQISETGHLVFATLHTNSAAQTIDRIISSFEENKQNFVRNQLSRVIEVVISQRLIPSKSGQVIPAMEIMTANDAIRTLIRDGKTHLIDNFISTGSQMGMTTLDKSLAELINSGQVDSNEAMKFSLRPDEVRRYLKRTP